MPKLNLELEFEAIGTHWFIELESAPTDELRSAMMARIEAFDVAYSRFRSDSIVTQMARKAGTYELPSDAPAMLDLYHWFYSLTDGAMTPLIGQVLSDAGYDASYSLKPVPLTTPPAWDDSIVMNGRQITLTRPALLDFGAMGKGYLVDIIAELIEHHGHTSYLVNAGGDMSYRGSEHIEIGLEDPIKLGTVIGTVQLESGWALCGSSGNRRAWGDYTHVIDPHTLTSPRDIAAIWVVAPSTMVADALTTALNFVAPAKLTHEFDFEYAIVGADGSLARSAQFPAHFFTAQPKGIQLS